MILEYLKPNSKILCPFDEEHSSFVKVLKNEGHSVLFSHLTGTGLSGITLLGLVGIFVNGKEETKKEDEADND